MFPGAIADRERADYVVVGAPLDISTTFQPGARFGPDRIRRFAETFDDYDRTTDTHFSDLDVCDAGDVHAWDDAREYLDHLAAELRAIRLDDAIPIVLGGEHTVTAAGVEAVEPELFVCLDAHLDLRNDYDGNEWSHACVTRRVLETAEEAIVLGARTGSPEEWGRADDDDVTVVPPEEVPRWIENPPESITSRLESASEVDDRSVYLSVDIDGADPAFAPGTGTMEPFGLTPREMRDAVRTVAPACSGFDVVEVNDRDDGQAAALAGKLLREFVHHHTTA